MSGQSVYLPKHVRQFGPSSPRISDKRRMRYYGKFQCVISLKFCGSFVLVFRIRNSNSEFFESFILINSIGITKRRKILFNFDTNTNVRENFEKYFLKKFWVIFCKILRIFSEKFRKTSGNILESLEEYCRNS